MRTNTRAQLPAVNDWRPRGTAKILDPEVLSRADQVTINLEKPGAEDALLAAGMALAKEVPTVLAAPDRDDLPWFLREADLSYPSRVTVVDTRPPEVTPQSGPEPVPRQVRHDTFIGCLMSGLSEQQYAEGRSHLTKIHETLRDHLDSPNNFCEGIQVGSTDSFGSPREALVTDLEAVKGSDQCLFYQYDDSSRPSGMWVELGAALAWGKPCTLFTPNLKGVPPAILEGKLPQLKIVEYGSHEQLLKLLEASPEVLGSQKLQTFMKTRAAKGLNSEQCAQLLEAATQAYPEGGDQARNSISMVDRLRNESWESSSGVTMTGVTFRQDFKTPEGRPDLPSAYASFLELRQAVIESGRDNPDFYAEKALRTEIFGNPGPEYGNVLRLTGNPGLSHWASQKIQSPQARERVAQLRPGLKNRELVRLVQIAVEAPEDYWERFSQAASYATPLRIEEALERLELPAEGHWQELQDFTQSLQGGKLNEEQVLGLLDWSVDHYDELKPAAVADALVNSWRGPAQESRRFLDEALGAGPKADWSENAERTADTYWLHGDFESRDRNLGLVKQAYEGGHLAADSLAAATQEFEHRLRLQRLLHKEPSEAVHSALEGLARPRPDEVNLEAIEDGIVIGDFIMDVH